METGDLIVTLDAGSGSVRASLYTVDGTCLRQHARPLAAAAGEAAAERDPAALWQTAIEAIAALQAPAARVAGVGVTAALGLVVIDRDQRPLTPLIGWQDRRAVRQAIEIERRLGPERLYAITGRRADPELTAPKLLWLRRHQEERLAAAHAVLSVKDWLVARLCGALVSDATSASYTLLLDVGRTCWSDELCDALGLPRALLPPLADASAIAGGLRPEVGAALGLLAGTPVVVGAPDGTAGAIGGGMVRPGIAVDVMGTTDVVFVQAQHLPQRRAADRRLILNRCAAGAGWSIGGPMAATGGAVAWFARLLGSDHAALEKAACDVPPCADGLLVAPSLAGSRTPRWDGAEQGGVAGLGFRHGPAHLYRAVLEGCAAEVAEVFDALAENAVPVNEIRAVGGGTASDLSLAIRAAMLGRPLLVPEVAEASSLGAAMLAAVGVGCCADLGQAAARMVRLRRRITPDPDWIMAYAGHGPRLAALRAALAPLRPKPD